MFNIVCFILIKLIFNRSAKVGKDLIKRVETNNPVYFLKRHVLFLFVGFNCNIAGQTVNVFIHFPKIISHRV